METVHAPELAATDWLNTDQPLSLKGLRGHIVLLDFWTYCCINCMHVLPELRYLEEKYRGDPFVAIGVHSAKFHNEREIQNVRNAVLRYDIRHPIALDNDYHIWQSYGIRAWPTLVLIGPTGHILGMVSGEGHLRELDNAIGEALAHFESTGDLTGQRPRFQLESDESGDLPLRYPGKVIADNENRRLYIADSGHHRIVITDFDGKLLDICGCGEADSKNGAFEEAAFHNPQGLALHEGKLLIADTDNHLIRLADLSTRTVTTLIGNGRMSLGPGIGGPGDSVSLNSPWDILVCQRYLFIAMAGCHQIWRYDFDRNEALPFAGTGREARVDGPVHRAAFAQPSGLATDGSSLFVADPEISSIRQITLGARPTVSTLAGGDLFDFGLKDGTGDEARFQHPLGVAYINGLVYVADSYNHCIRKLDPDNGAVQTLALSFQNSASGEQEDIIDRLDEPGGIAAMDQNLIVADTNHHRICLLEPSENNIHPLAVTSMINGSRL